MINGGFEIGDRVDVRKKHPCGSHQFEIIRTGVDFRLKCLGCSHQISVTREKFFKIVKNAQKLDTK